jgi:hypothetical protein
MTTQLGKERGPDSHDRRAMLDWPHNHTEAHKKFL